MSGEQGLCIHAIIVDVVVEAVHVPVFQKGR